MLGTDATFSSWECTSVWRMNIWKCCNYTYAVCVFSHPQRPCQRPSPTDVSPEHLAGTFQILRQARGVGHTYSGGLVPQSLNSGGKVGGDHHWTTRAYTCIHLLLHDWTLCVHGAWLPTNENDNRLKMQTSGANLDWNNSLVMQWLVCNHYNAMNDFVVNFMEMANHWLWNNNSYKARN